MPRYLAEGEYFEYMKQRLKKWLMKTDYDPPHIRYWEAIVIGFIELIALLIFYYQIK